ncbi:MAG: chloride channel protein, partial [Acetobacteraceae bacterium]|nr:chloride channel protein [Acetobacteraceae bacterium]
MQLARRMRFRLSDHESRRVKVEIAIWSRRSLFILGGIVVGAAAVGMAVLADVAQHAFHALAVRWPRAPLAITPVGFALAVYVTRRFFRNSEGSGIPQAIAARQLADQAARARLVSIRLAIGKVLVTVFGLLCGASAGREGPTVQVGASVMFAVGKLSPRRQPGLILAGASAGVAAAFNTPLAGIVFGIEEMSRSFEARASGLIIAGIIAAGLASRSLVGEYTYFGTSSATIQGGLGWLAVLICGVAGGVFGGVFSRILIEVGRGLPGTAGRAIRRYPVGFAAICGLGVALCGLVPGVTVYGTGYDQARAMLESGVLTSPWFGILKLVATIFTSISGIPGGIFSPSLAVGAGIGANIAAFLPGVSFSAIVILGMVSYFAGVVQAPITAFTIVTEMTNDHTMVVPLMTAALIGHA